eukprot:TRINITY_DN1777_c0_g1_i1.p1 TRINITY_DN1777_c0_g1~~TRINITY_DN1777_c0_g1_i1.p1  ORF type:complete len:583 (-),score=133.97 TRINITY_DN1777_c0_g1_i1:108-1763(-)
MSGRAKSFQSAANGMLFQSPRFAMGQSHADPAEATFKSWLNGSRKQDLWKAWHSLDYNGNARVSLAEIDKWVSESFPTLNNKPALMRAYKATISGEKDGYVHRMDFPVLLRNVLFFNKLWDAFEGIDADSDRRLTFQEFQAGLDKLGMSGGGQQQARAIFDQLDRNRGGLVLFDEFCKWAASQQCPVDSGVYDATAMAPNPLHQLRASQGQRGGGTQALMNAGRTLTTPRGGGGSRLGSSGGQQQPFQLPGAGTRAVTMAAGGGTMKRASAVSLGVIRLDYDYPPAPGDIDHPGSFGYDVYYRVVPGLTFKMCQSGKLTPEVEREFKEAIDWMEAKGVSGITGDCGFMMYFQTLARRNTSKPVFMSSLAQLPAVTCGYSRNELIAILTANGQTLRPMRNLIKEECGVDPDEKRFIIVGCEDVPGFEAVAKGEKVDVERVTPGIVAKAMDTLRKNPAIKAFLFECTELPPYSDAVRKATGLPVFDAITCCDFFMTGMKDNARFGINDWQQGWDGQQETYRFGDNLDQGDRNKLVNKPGKMPLRPPGVGRQNF